MALTSATHHSHMRVASVATQTEDAAATHAATASVPGALHAVPALDAHAAPAHAVKYAAPARVITNIEQLMEPPVPHIQEQSLEVAKIIPPERGSEHSIVQIVNVPVPQMMEDTVDLPPVPEAMEETPEATPLQHSAEQIVDVPVREVMPAPTGRAKVLNTGNESRCGHRNALIVQDEYTSWIESYSMKTKEIGNSGLFAEVSSSGSKLG